MAKLSCPNCRRDTAQTLNQLLDHACFEYFLCARCGHVWAVAKDGSGRTEDLTPRTADPKPQHAGR